MIDYVNYPFAPVDGYRSDGNGAWATQSLFIETCRWKPDSGKPAPLYTLGDTEKYSEEWDRVFPSARLIYVYSQGEYDAMRKLVGAYKGWQALMSLKWFRDEKDLWEAEWKMREASEARMNLKILSIETAGAAKALWDEARGKTAGRPKKVAKVARSTAEEDDADGARVLEFIKRK